MEKLSEVLKDLILESGMSTRKIASLSGVSAVQYSRYLKGDYPTINVAIRIAKYFNCTLDYLFGLTEHKKPCENLVNEYNKEYFLVRYQELLDKSKITHWKLCKQIGLSESALRHWKYGETPKMETLFLIVTELSASLDYLLSQRS